MAKGKKPRNSQKRLNPAKFHIEQATPADASRYVASFSRLVYSYEVIKDKKNTEQVRQVEARNLEVQRFQRQFVKPSEEQFFNITSNNVRVFFFVKDSFDFGFAIVDFEDNNSAYISNLTVYKHLMGYGTIFYQMLEKHLKDCGIKKVTLKALFEGTKPFWQKMGFSPEDGSKTEYYKFL